MLLPAIITNQRCQSLLVLQSSLVQSALPLLRALVESSCSDPNEERGQTLLFCFLHPPLCIYSGISDNPRITVYDRVDVVPGYNDDWADPSEFVLDAINQCNARDIHVIIDSVDILLSDSGSQTKTYRFLRSVKSIVDSRSQESHLTLHIQNSCDLLSSIVHTSFSSTLTHILVHSPALLQYLAKEYLLPPPPASPDAKFWGIFIPVSERLSDLARIVYGAGGEGSGGTSEFVVEVISRGGEFNNGNGRRKTVERVLEGWEVKRSVAVELTDMTTLKHLFGKVGTITEEAANPAQNLSFNLNLTKSQHQARAQVPLPYAHEGKSVETHVAAILYDPDSGDDIDDDDPDEDLDI